MKRIYVVLTMIFLFLFSACHQKPVDKKETVELPRMVVVQGEVYVDVDKDPSKEPRCGVMDGYITSTVPRGEKPKKNDQSNFGKDYGYQLWTEDSIQVNIEDDWIIFEKEK